ncbi:MAG TPA: hypothetical protein VKH41_16305 [Myxococcota bacterium]|nr:hypothetical protein [Myxococcota bacterium]
MVGYGVLPPGWSGRIRGVLADGSPLDVFASNTGSTSVIRLSPPVP